MDIVSPVILSHQVPRHPASCLPTLARRLEHRPDEDSRVAPLTSIPSRLGGQWVPVRIPVRDSHPFPVVSPSIRTLRRPDADYMLLDARTTTRKVFSNSGIPTSNIESCVNPRVCQLRKESNYVLLYLGTTSRYYITCLPLHVFVVSVSTACARENSKLTTSETSKPPFTIATSPFFANTRLLLAVTSLRSRLDPANQS